MITELRDSIEHYFFYLSFRQSFLLQLMFCLIEEFIQRWFYAPPSIFHMCLCFQ